MIHFHFRLSPLHFFYLLRLSFYLSVFSKPLVLLHITDPEKSPTTKSTYMNDYITFGDIHCGMAKKPLIPYNMDSSRSRLPINGIISGAAINRASIELGDYRLINRKQWKSTYKDSYRKPSIVPVSNNGIASDMAKASHMRLNAA